MHQFKDIEGDEWTVNVHALALAKVESVLGVSFSEPGEQDGPLMRIIYNPIFAFQVIYLLCEGQAKARGLSDEKFSERLVGDAFSTARQTLLNAIAEFFPDPSRRKAAKQLVQTMFEAEKLLVSKAAEKLKGLDMDKFTDEVMNAQRP